MSRLGRVLLMVCLLDLATTLWLIGFFNAGEANPILNYYLIEWGSLGLVASKMWLVLIPLFVLEVGSRYCPYAGKRIRFYYGSVITLYITVFFGASLFQHIV